MCLPLTTLLAFTLSLFPFFSSQVSAVNPQFLARREHPSSSLILSSRQHRVPCSILDLCINVNVDLLANASQHGPASDPLDLGSNIHLCLCLKDLDIFLDTNVDIKALIGILGKNIVSALITALINTSPDASKCSIPLHAHQTCSSHDPCHYECDPHYVRVGDICVCAPPYTSCNDDCDIFPKGCGTAVPRSFKARNVPIATITEAKAMCKPYETVCGIPGREKSFHFECIDVNIAGDSCGGCMTPHPFPQADSVLHVLGTDCTRIPNAKNSECFEQRCIVSKCNLGWHPILSRNACILDAGDPSNLKPQKVLHREDSLTIVAKIGAIVSLVPGLEYNPSQIPAGPSSLAVIPDLLGGINNATSTLIASTDVPSLLNNLDALLNFSSVASSILSSCDCQRDLGLSDLEDALGIIVAGLLNLKNWCAYNVPSDFNLSSLLSGLGYL
jgi:CPL1-like protein